MSLKLAKLTGQFRRLEQLNAVVRRKMEILACPDWRGRVMHVLGGETKLSAWERAKASEAARLAAAYRKAPPQWWIERHHAKLCAEALRKSGWARPNATHPLTYVGTKEYALQPLQRGPSLLRGCSLARRDARPARRNTDLPTIYFAPFELRGPAPLSAACAAASPRKRARRRASPVRPAAPVIPSNAHSQWVNISAKDAIMEIFGGHAQARASP